jgi:hypothetical protein
MSVAISKTTFLYGLIIAILVSSAVSAVVSTQWTVGPQGLKGDKGDAGATGATGPQGIPGEPANETELLILKDRVNDLENRLAAIEDRFSLRGYWKFDEGTGTTAYDSSVYDNTGQLNWGGLWVDGKYNKCLSFGGASEYVYVSTLISGKLRLQCFALEAWIFMNQRPYEQVRPSHTILDIGSYYGYGYTLQFAAPTSENDHLVLVIGDGVASRTLIDYNSTNDLTLNQWHHIVATYNGSVAKLYIDGAPKASSVSQHYEIKYGDYNFVIGVRYGTNDFFVGLIDNVIVYDRAIADDEVIQHYTSPPP